MIDFSKIPRGRDKNPQPQPDKDDQIPLHKLNIPLSSKKEKDQAKGLQFSQIKQDAVKDQIQDKKSLDKSRKTYKSALSAAEKLLLPQTDISSSSIDDAERTVKELIAYVESGTQELLDFVFSQDSFEAHYLAFNLVNASILSLELGYCFGYNEAQLTGLGVCAFIHDIGMRMCMDIASSPRRLSLSEFQKIKRHTLDGVQIVKKIKPDIDPRILAGIEQEHERANGTGYPKGAKLDGINEWAQIIGFNDVYEALTHKRPFRPAYSIQEAVKIILSSKDNFPKKIIKAYLERIGLYPRGTLVKLNTEETAYVLHNNPLAPIAPVVSVIFDPQGNRLDPKREIDLNKNPSFYII